MPVYLFWGEDDYAIAQAVQQLRDRVLDPNWRDFNEQKLAGDPDAVREGLTLALTPPFGMGGRLIWLEDTSICQQCPETLLTQLERTLQDLPETSTLVFTTSKKIDGRLKSTKLLKQYATVSEFSRIPPWKTDELLQRVQQIAKEIGVKLTPAATELLCEAVGNDTRRLTQELQKLNLYGENQSQPLDVDLVSALVTFNTQNSLHLATAIRKGDIARALTLVTDLLNRNEPALRMVATLIGQFRTWVWIKLMVERGERDEKAIAQAAGVGNPKRIYFLRQEVQPLSLQNLLATLAILLELEINLKRGADPVSTLQIKVIELCRTCNPAFFPSAKPVSTQRG